MALPIQTIYFRGFIMCFECVSGRFVEGRSVDFWFLSIGRFFRYIEVVSVTLRVFYPSLYGFPSSMLLSITFGDLSHFVASRRFAGSIPHFSNPIHHFIGFLPFH